MLFTLHVQYNDLISGLVVWLWGGGEESLFSLLLAYLSPIASELHAL